LNIIHIAPRKGSVHCVPIFRLRLRNGASIGPATLKRLWSIAAASDEIAVSREAIRLGDTRGVHAYVVSGPSHLANLTSVETELRRLLQEALNTAHIELTRFL